MSKCKNHVVSQFLNVYWSGTNATVSDKRFQSLKTLHAKVCLLLWVLPVCWGSLSDDRLSGELLENLNMPFCLHSMLWVRAK